MGPGEFVACPTSFSPDIKTPGGVELTDGQDLGIVN